MPIAIHTPLGTGNHEPVTGVSRESSPRASASIFCSRASPLARPRSTLMLPSVMMKGVTRSRVMSSPVSSPPRAETPMPASAADQGSAPWRKSHATTTVVSATPEPTDRSIPPWIITTVMPTAVIATTTVWRAMVTRFCVPAKVSGLSATNNP
jgi:hypothetical protein